MYACPCSSVVERSTCIPEIEHAEAHSSILCGGSFVFGLNVVFRYDFFFFGVKSPIRAIFFLFLLV